MTFIIKTNYDNGGYVNDKFEFDVEGYDYILNQNTVFTEGTLAINDYEKLSFILSKYEKIDEETVVIGNTTWKLMKGNMTWIK